MEIRCIYLNARTLHLIRTVREEGLSIPPLIILVLISARLRLIESDTPVAPSFHRPPGRRTFNVEEASCNYQARSETNREAASSSEVFRPVVYVCCFVVQRLFRQCLRTATSARCLFHLLLVRRPLCAHRNRATERDAYV